jgi:hypothetical protein
MTRRATHNPGPLDEILGVVKAINRDVFRTWRLLISVVAGAVARLARAVPLVARRWVTGWSRVRDYHTDTRAALSSNDSIVAGAAAAAGVRAFAFGLVLAGAFTIAPRGAWEPGVFTMVGELLWAAARFVIIALLLPRGAVTRSRLAVVFCAGLAPYVFGATVLLRFVALLLSAALTRRGLLAADLPERDAVLAVAWSFGGQAGAIALGWLARAAVALLTGA